jgi:hypothetical protein
MTLKLGSRCPVLIDSIEVPAAGANVSDEHVDVVEDDPALTSVRDDAIPHVCDSHDDGVSQGGLRLVSIGSYRRVASARLLRTPQANRYSECRWSRVGQRDAGCTVRVSFKIGSR